MAQVAAVSPRGAPLLGSLWFLFADGRFWFSSHSSSPLIKAAERNAEVAVIVDEFDPPENIRQVRIRGSPRVEDHDALRVRDIYRRYLGTDLAGWPPFLNERTDDTSWILWSVCPVTGVVGASRGFRARGSGAVTAGGVVASSAMEYDHGRVACTGPLLIRWYYFRSVPSECPTRRSVRCASGRSVPPGYGAAPISCTSTTSTRADSPRTPRRPSMSGEPSSRWSPPTSRSLRSTCSYGTASP